MRTFAPFVLLALTACPSPMLTCGPGTHADGSQCVADTVTPDGGAAPDGGVVPDGGMATDLPTTAIVTPSPIRIMQGFAACPSVEVGFADGHSAVLILDPTYRVPVNRAVLLSRSGFSLNWVSTDGLVRTSALPNCDAALVGLQPGMSTVSLEVVGPDGTRRAIGSARVEVVALPASGVTMTGAALRLDDLLLPAMYRRPLTLAASPSNVVPLGETLPLELSFDAAGVPDGTTFLVVPENLTVTFADPTLAEWDGSTGVKGLGAGTTTVTVSYSAAGRPLGSIDLPLWVSASQQTVDLAFTLPTADDGFVLPETFRYGDSMEVGQCFSLDAVATTSDVEPGQSQPSAFQRYVTAQATWSPQGHGLTQSADRPNRFCATEAGEAAVRACHGGICGNLGIVVVEPMSLGPSLQAAMPSEIHIGAVSGPTVVCVDVQLTASVGTAAPRDVSQSVSLRFASTFASPNALPFYPAYDTSTGEPQHDGTKLCIDVLMSGTQPSGLRMFWGGGQAEITTLVKF